jgi:hypothetical protein
MDIIPSSFFESDSRATDSTSEPLDRSATDHPELAGSILNEREDVHLPYGGTQRPHGRPDPDFPPWNSNRATKVALDLLGAAGGVTPLAKNGSLTLVRTSDDDQNCLPRCEFWSGADGSSGGLFIGHIADLVAPPKYLALTRTTGRQARRLGPDSQLLILWRCLSKAQVNASRP